MSIDLSAFRLMVDERCEAEKAYPAFTNLHEAYAVILEELDECWDHIKQKDPDIEALKVEFAQVGAMVSKAIELCERLK